nr:hypothetical protein [Tanacetum cinerariifolium]
MRLSTARHLLSMFLTYLEIVELRKWIGHCKQEKKPLQTDNLRNQANKHMTDRQFEVGDWVYLKLQPHKQIHPVFHISQLKKCHGKDHSVGVLPQLIEDGILENKPMAILERRLRKVNNKPVMFVLIQWTNKPDKKSLKKMELIRAKSEVNTVELEVSTASRKVKLVLLAESLLLAYC